MISRLRTGFGLRLGTGAIAFLAALAMTHGQPASASVVGPGGTVYTSTGYCLPELGGSSVWYSGVSSMPATYLRVWKYEHASGTYSVTPWARGVENRTGAVVAPTSASAGWHLLYIEYAYQNLLGTWDFAGEWVRFGDSYWCYSR